MSVLPEAIIERDLELAAIRRFVDSIPDGPRALVLSGPPGIGKTTLWSEAVAGARRAGYRVMESRPTESEAGFAFAALADLLGGAFATHRGELPPPQERSMGAALLLLDYPTAIDPRAVAAAAVSLVGRLAAEGPVVVAIDDAQWLDVASARVLDFLIRRLSGPVGLLVSLRPSDSGRSPLDLDRVPALAIEKLTLRPLSLAAVQHLVRERRGLSLSRPALARVFTASGGNPYFALELARTMQDQAATRSSREPLPLPATLRDLAAARIDGLSWRARQAGLLVAVSLDPTVDVVALAMASRSEALAALAEAEAAEVLTREGGKLRFSHPLLASAIFDAARADEIRTAHRCLATAVGSAEERGVHLAQSVEGIDPGVASQIEDAARSTAERGAQDVAAELYEAARAATPQDDAVALARRGLGLGRAWNDLGAFAAARPAAEAALAVAPTPGLRAEALELLATMDWYAGDAAAATGHIEEALSGLAVNDGLAAAIRARFARFNFSHDIARAIRYATQAIDVIDERENPGLLGHVLIDRAVAGVLHGEVIDPVMLARGIALEESAAPNLPNGPQPMPLIWFHCTDDIESARRRCSWEMAWYRDRGNELMQADRASHLAMAELRAGRIDEATRLVAESCAAIADLEARGPIALIYEKRAMVEAFRGDTASARAALLPQIEAFEQRGQRWWAALELSTLAFASFTEGDDAAAEEALARMREHAESIGVQDILFDRSEPFEIDARIRRGDLEGARVALARLEARGAVVPRPWITTVLPAARALVATASGKIAEALAPFAGSPDGSGPPFELAWSRLIEGRIRRRARQKRLAADALRAAAEQFERIGARTWGARARRELDRVGLRHVARDELSPSERRVAELAASGLTNREIARSAFMSEKTVETNLARVYGKLGIRSRAELGARISGMTRGSVPQT